MTTSLKILVFLTIEITCILATTPLKCLFMESDLPNIFSKSASSVYDVQKTNPLQIDPLRFDYINVDEKDLLMNITELEYTGFNDAIVDDFSISFKQNYTRISFHTLMLAKANYKFGGSFFSKPIFGEGPMTGIFKNTKIEIVMPFEIVEDEKMQKYIDLKTFYSWADLPEGEFVFNELYNGDKEKSDIMHSLINQNFKIFCQEFGKPFMSRIAEYFFTVFRNQMLSIPLKDFTAC